LSQLVDVLPNVVAVYSIVTVCFVVARPQNEALVPDPTIRVFFRTAQPVTSICVAGERYSYVISPQRDEPFCNRQTANRPRSPDQSTEELGTPIVP
jgi:hypothetical protein